MAQPPLHSTNLGQNLSAEPSAEDLSSEILIPLQFQRPLQVAVRTAACMETTIAHNE